MKIIGGVSYDVTFEKSRSKIATYRSDRLS